MMGGTNTPGWSLHLDEQEESFGLINSPSWDLAFVRDLMSGQLGYRVRKRDEDATHLMRALVHPMGMNQGETFVDIPPIQCLIIPLPWPQLSVYQEQDQLPTCACTRSGSMPYL